MDMGMGDALDYLYMLRFLVTDLGLAFAGGNKILT